jgi:predicted 3-demethylubiquinone-9 3-methyltransferase (glyoxalase superfamily)
MAQAIVRFTIGAQRAVPPTDGTDATASDRITERKSNMQKIKTCLWFDGKAEEAARFYTSVFKNSKMGDIERMPEGGPAPAGSVITVIFELEGVEFMALNGGPEFQFNEAHSIYVDCKDQKEVDELWSKLTADGGEESYCGWLKDKFGVSWQIVPAALSRMMADPDRDRARRVMEAMLKMRKIDVPTLERAYEAASTVDA